ncbi:serine/threonine-protein kinase DCLK3 [Poecilia formosa]|uniref:serine/threonine-protein kinase DCLK3 n=1 Tax=Poecilia formosa TaxID=48698 RepID=UPI0004448ED2|nr:PREDICTED: serine/threonine-protein kinase DCLK3 [Poecilia formosa]
MKARNGGEVARNTKWGVAGPPAPLLKRAGWAPQPWPLPPHQVERVYRPLIPPPHPPLFHTRHAEESAERPHLVTIVRPCSQNGLRKVTVLLNRRAVVSFEQLLLDLSEALGFPRWHRGRVTRLYTTHAREVRGVCDFFCGEVAFLALGKARPVLNSVQDALEELFPEHSHYRADALRVWEKKLRPAPDKAAKADSGYSEETENTGKVQEAQRDAHTQVKNHTDAHTSQHADKNQQGQYIPDSQKSNKKNSCKKTAHLPNNLQKLRVRGEVKKRHPSPIGPFKHNELLRDADIPSPILCENCLATKSRPLAPGLIGTLSGRVPLPPVSKKQKGSHHTDQEVKPSDVSNSPSSPQVSRDKEKSCAPLQLLRPAPHAASAHTEARLADSCVLPSEGTGLTLADIERCYEIGRLIGDGNFAVVRECRRRDDGQPVAMKIVERSKLIGREHMMQNELSLLGSLSHPRIVRLLAHHHTRTHSYLVMELVSGGDLFEAINDKGKFPEPEAGRMVSDVSEALDYIHCRSIVHRDLKPENLLIEKVSAGIGRLKLGDFGLAMVVTEPVFTICGTPTYVAPEILCETGYGVAVDVWALGVILYILLCGFAPFRSRDRDQEELFKLIKHAELHFPSPYWDSISEEAKGLVRSLLKPDPTVRLTAEQILQHHWVKAMASVCSQRALPDKTKRDSADSEAELHRAAPTKAAESLANQIAGNSGTKKEISPRRHDEFTTRGQDQNKTPLVQSEDMSNIDTAASQKKKQTPLYETACREKPETISAEQHSRENIQDSRQKLTNVDLLNQSDSSITQTESSSQNKLQSKQNGEQQWPVDPTALTKHQQ